MTTEEKKQPSIATPAAEETARIAGDPMKPAETALSEAEQMRAETRDIKDRLLRAQAEMQNVTRRLTDEKHTAVRFAVADFARALLPVLDNFERTMASLQEHHHDDAVIQGVKLVYDMLKKTLAENHVTPIDALHKTFDPARHEALMRKETAEHPEGTVVEEFERGYMLHDRLLRASKVALAARPAASGSTD